MRPKRALWFREKLVFNVEHSGTREIATSHTGKQNHRCKRCGRAFVLNPNNAVVTEEHRTLVERLLLERISLCGMEREDFVALLAQGMGQDQKAGKKRKAATREATAKEPTLPPEPLTADVAEFWGHGPVPEEIWGSLQTPSTPAAVVKRLGSFPFWRGEEKILSALDPLYTLASVRGVDILLGTQKRETKAGSGVGGTSESDD